MSTSFFIVIAILTLICVGFLIALNIIEDKVKHHKVFVVIIDRLIFALFVIATLYIVWFVVYHLVWFYCF